MSDVWTKLEFIKIIVMMYTQIQTNQIYLNSNYKPHSIVEGRFCNYFLKLFP